MATGTIILNNPINFINSCSWNEGIGTYAEQSIYKINRIAFISFTARMTATGVERHICSLPINMRPITNIIWLSCNRYNNAAVHDGECKVAWKDNETKILLS